MELFRTVSRRQIFRGLAVAVICLAVIVTAFSGAALPASGRSRRLPVYSVGREEKVISISFDAAWGNEDTQTLIDILARRGIKTTFFVVGEWVDKYPESVKALSDAGHEVMNHSDTHPHMSKLPKAEIRAEIERCNDKVEAITGVRPTLFRAPYGEYCDALLEVLDELGMTCIQWDVDSLDWKDPAPQEILSRVCSRVKSGSIVLFHNAAVNTPAALPSLLEQLQGEGYRIVPVSQNIYYENFEIDHEGCQRKCVPEASGTDSAG